MFWARVDNRLVHGQVIEAWIPYAGARVLLVCNDELAADVVRQEIMSLAIPRNVRAHFIPTERAKPFLDAEIAVERSAVMALFADCCDARRAAEHGFAMDVLNIGNIHYGPNRQQICPHVALSQDDKSCLRYFADHGVELDFRCLPTEPVHVRTVW